jgi:sodium/bile acid cotransporter 7
MINLRGGILSWLHAGGKIYREGRETKSVHVYGRKWDLAPSEYEALW